MVEGTIKYGNVEQALAMARNPTGQNISCSCSAYCTARNLFLKAGNVIQPVGWQSAKARARRLLESYSRGDEVKAIASRNFNLSSSEGPLPHFGLLD